MTLARPIRVCCMIDNLGLAGTEQWLLRLVGSFNRSQVDPYLCLLDGTDASSRQYEPADVPVLRLAVRSVMRPSTFKAAWRFVRYLRTNRIDILQLHFTNSTNFGALLARIAGVRVIIRTRRNMGYWMTPWDRRFGRAIACLTTATIANSNACRDAAIRDDGVKLASIFVIPNGIDLKRFAQIGPTTLHRPADRPWQVGIVANLRQVKDIQTFVRAAAQVLRVVPNVEFLVAGEGPERRNIEELISILGITSQVQLMGSVADIPGFLERLDIAVLCSQSEGLSNALLEYFAAGRPVIATDVGGNSDLVQHETTGLFVRVGDVNDLADAMVRLLVDRLLASRLAKQGKLLMEDKFRAGIEPDGYVSAYMTLMQQTLSPLSPKRLAATEPAFACIKCERTHSVTEIID